MDTGTGSVAAERGVLRLGGGAAMLGGVLGLVVNIFHPRVDEYTAAAEVEMVAASGSWLLIHWLAAWTVMLLFVGLVVAGSYIERAGSPTWGRLARASAVAGGVVGFIAVAIDGMANKAVAAVGGAGAEAVAELSFAMFTALIGTSFGLTPVLFGLAQLATRTFDRWLGLLAVGSGAVGLVVASIHYLAGPSTFVTNILFTIAAMATTIWTITVGWRLWNAADAPATEPTPATVIA